MTGSNAIPPFKSLAPGDIPWARAVTEALTSRDNKSDQALQAAQTAITQQAGIFSAIENQAGAISQVEESVAPTEATAAPTPPLVSSQAATIVAEWDGGLVDDASTAPVSYILVEASLIENPDPEADPPYAQVSSLSSGAATFAASIIGAVPGDVVWVRFRAVTWNGLTSEPSDAVSVVVAPVGIVDLDEAIVEAIDEANTNADAALTAANGKNTNYYQATMPTGGTYLVGDTWFDTDDSNKLYTWSGSAWVLTQDAASAAQAAATAQTAAGTALTAANGKNTNYYGPSTPTPPGGGFKTGDNWFDTDDDYKLYVWSGSAWVLAQDSASAATAAGNAQTTANSKSTNYFQTTAPTPPGGGFKVGDNWFDTDDNNKLYVWSGSAWVLAQDSAAATTLAGTKNSIWHQASAPAGTSHRVGDVWWDTDDGNKMYEWNGSSWVANEFGGSAIANAAITNAKIQDAAVTNAKILDATILAAKIGDAQITSAKIQDAAITTAKIGDAQINNAKIADLAVTNAKIADLAVTNAKISDLNASKINAGIISADRIGANTIAASKLLVGDFENYFYDPTFSDPAGYFPWTVVGSTIEKNGTGAQHGQYALNSDFAATPNDKFKVTATRANITSSGGTSRVYIQWYNAAGAGTGTTPAVSFTTATTTTSGEITPPAGTVRGRVGFYTEADMGAGVRVSFSNVLIRRLVQGNLIVDGAITAGSAIIEDGAITNAKIGNVDAGKITAGTINADRIGANSIGVQKLLITSLENLIQDNSFEYNSAAAWQLNASTTNTTTAPRSGVRALTCPTTGTAYVCAQTVSRFAVQPGDQYRLSAWVRKAAGTSVLNGVTLRFATSATETGATTPTVDLALTPNGTGTTYVRITGTYTVPAGVYWLQTQIIVRDTTASQTYYVDDVECYKMSSGELIVDGAIDGKVITGATVRTAATGQRIQLDTGGLKSYNAANVVTGELQASSGGLLLSGKFRSGSGNQRVEIDSNSVDFFDTTGLAGGTVIGYNDSPGNPSTAGVQIQAPAGNSFFGYINRPEGGSATFTTPAIYTPLIEGTEVVTQGGMNAGVPLGSGQAVISPSPADVLPAGQVTVLSTSGQRGRVTFTNASRVEIPNVFSSTYTVYKVFLTVTSLSAVGSLFLQFRTASAIATAANYHYTRDYGFNNTPTAVGSVGQTRIELVGGSGLAHDVEITFYGTASAETTRMAAVSRTLGGSAPHVNIPSQTAGHYYGALDVRGFNILPASGTITGYMTIYGIA